MNSRRWEQINALLDAAAALPAEERDAFLQDECGDDPELLNEVRSLLKAEAEAGSFLEKPAHEYAASLVDQAANQNALIGRVVDGYRILDVLGRGGMGVVFRVRNLKLDRVEALKVIAPFMVRDPVFMRRFEQEAQALARIHHPNIVTIFNLRESELGHYITMEYVEGETLADVLANKGALSWEQALPLFKQLLSALEYAHARGIIHRDIKPRNVMLTPEGTVKIMDFGLARFYQEQDLTRTEGLSGSLYYMSPEQVRGAAKLDQRTDIYSAGMTLYEMLTGRLPFDKTNSRFRILETIVEREFPPPHQFRTSLPRSVSDIVMKALRKDPNQRYQRASEMLAEIQALETKQRDRPPQAVPAAQVGTTAPSDGRIRRWATYGSIAALTMLLIWSAVRWGPALFDATQEEIRPNTLRIATHLPAVTDTASSSVDADPSATDTTATSHLQTETTPPPTGREPARRSRDEAMSSPQETASSPEETTPPDEDTPPPRGDEALSRESTSPIETSPTVVDEQSEAMTDPDETPDSPELTVVEAARAQSDELRRRLKEAALSSDWSDLPGPAATFYSELLQGFSRSFVIVDAGVEIDHTRAVSDGATASFPVMLRLEYKQRGRDQVQSLPIPATWVWRLEGASLTLVAIQKTDS